MNPTPSMPVGCRRSGFGRQDVAMESTLTDVVFLSCTLVNRTEMTEAQKAALRNRLAAEAELGPNQADTDTAADLMSPKVGGQRKVPLQQSYSSTTNAQSAPQLQSYKSTSNAQSAQQQQGYNLTPNAQSAQQQQGYNSTLNAQSFAPIAQQPNGAASWNP